MPAQAQMKKATIEQLQRHIKMHSERADDDRAAITVLGSFLRSGGKINTSFAVNDTWPNVDGEFELVPDPVRSRQPKRDLLFK